MSYGTIMLRYRRCAFRWVASLFHNLMFYWIVILSARNRLFSKLINEMKNATFFNGFLMGCFEGGERCNFPLEKGWLLRKICQGTAGYVVFYINL